MDNLVVLDNKGGAAGNDRPATEVGEESRGT